MASVTGVLGSVIPKLALLLNDEYKLQTGVRKKIESLSRELESMYEAVRNVAQVPLEELDVSARLWARDVRELSYDVEDILDTFLVRVDGCNNPDPNRFKRAAEKIDKLFSKTKARHQIAAMIESINEKAEEIASRPDRYRVDEIVSKPASWPTVDPRLKAMSREVTELVGIEKPVDELISKLSPLGDDEMKMVCVFGAGGLGKTTLAKAVYDKLKGDFMYTAFVPVGRVPDLKKVFIDILIQLNKDKYYMDTKYRLLDADQLIKELREYLKDKRYLVVIDDIWQKDSWEAIKSVLIGNDNGSRIITTTRNMEVAAEAGVVYKLQPLSYDSSKKLFYTRTFGRGGKSIDNQLAEVSDKILKKCDGIPLAIITMASLLMGKPREVWFEELWFGQNKNNRQVAETMYILALSYYDLPLHLRTCLLYFSAFSEDHVIEKDALIWKWIGEGFIQELQGSSLFEIGESYFNDLINRSMIQPVKFKLDGVIQYCRVHSMVLDLIHFISYEENFVFVLDEDNHKRPQGKVRRFALHNIRGEHSLQDIVDLEQMRSFNAIGCLTYMIGKSSFSFLRVLDLHSCGSLEGYDLEHLGKLIQLRFLGLRNTLVSKLPERMGHLKFLQTLMLEGSGVEELPESMGSLTELRCLNADWKTRVPGWIGKLASLQQLKMYPGVGDDESSTRWFVKELGKLTQLRVLRFMIKVQDVEQIRQLLESLSKLHDVRDIHFGYYGVQLNNG